MNTVKVTNYFSFRSKLLQWIATFENAIFLEDALTKTICVGVGVQDLFLDLDTLPTDEWLFGYVTYDHKNNLEDLVSENSETISFDRSYFFSPEIVVILKEDTFIIEKGEMDITALFSVIENIPEKHIPKSECNVFPKITREEYLKTVLELQKHIYRGDIYEINFCQEFIGEQVELNPTKVYEQLITASPMPFSVFLKQGEKYALCASPERFIKKEGDRIISQPIKGTAKRGLTKEEDLTLIRELENNAKERAENVMAVDVVRNDFARVAIPGTVEVNELCKVYTFRQLHQMISTVSAKIAKDTKFSDVVRASFPMASMTGAPKIRAMQLIEEYEQSKRGLYSGTIGYLSPSGNFDFNVVIRTIFYNAQNKLLSFSVGSAITAKSGAECEYQECLLKAKAMLQVLEGK